MLQIGRQSVPYHLLFFKKRRVTGEYIFDLILALYSGKEADANIIQKIQRNLQIKWNMETESILTFIERAVNKLFDVSFPS
tara:strand:- start:188 stop:430 length:243 start_codon:yes stop_codon:yes gene_type:complete